LESETKLLENNIESLTAELNSGITDHTKLSEIALQIQSLKDEIDIKTLRWLELSEIK
jgi:ATP-binding cassette subfamily F protein uup